MKRSFTRVLVALIGVMGLAGCAVLDQRDRGELEAAYGANRPQWQASHADKVIAPGADWMIYLNGSDPDGDLRFIQVWMSTPTRTTTPVRLCIDPDQRARLSGYLYLKTAELREDSPDLFRDWLLLSLYLEDRAGHVSEAGEFFLQFRLGQRAGVPPAGVFEERLLGKIPVDLFPEDTVESGAPVWP